MRETAATATVRAAVAGVSAHLVWQIFARLGAFGFKAVVVRALGPAQFAFAEIRLGLLVALALLPAIHGFRKVALRAATDRAAAALCRVAVGVTVVAGVVIGGAMIAADQKNIAALAICTAAVIVRAFAETPVVFARRRERYAASSRARGISTLISGAATSLAVALMMSPAHGAAASAVGHLAYTLLLVVTMSVAKGPEPVPWLSLHETRALLRADDLAMAVIATGEGFLKFILGNGEGIILDLTCSDNDKGAYKLAGNIASMLARFFSEALEEQSFNVFHRLAPAFRNRPAVLNAESEYKTEGGNTDEEEEMRSTCVSTLVLGLKASLVVSLLFAVIGPPYSYALLRLLYGARWADKTPAARLLTQYLAYNVFMAANGVSEAFVTAAASTAELKHQSMFAMALSVTYMASLYWAARTYAATGIIVVNCANMAIRTVYSMWFFTTITGKSAWALRNALPHPGVLIALFAARRASFVSEWYFFGEGALHAVDGFFELATRVALHAVSGIMALAVFAIAMYVFERDFVSRLRALGSMGSIPTIDKESTETSNRSASVCRDSPEERRHAD